MSLLEIIKEFRLLMTSIVAATIFIISGYTTYTKIYTTIEQNNKQVELTQISILNSLIRTLEKNPCKTSRDEWGEYNMLHSQYYKLMKKHNPLLDDMDFRPMERLTEDSCKCYKGGDDCE